MPQLASTQYAQWLLAQDATASWDGTGPIVGVLVDFLRAEGVVSGGSEEGPYEWRWTYPPPFWMHVLNVIHLLQSKKYISRATALHCLMLAKEYVQSHPPGQPTLPGGSAEKLCE